MKFRFFILKWNQGLLILAGLVSFSLIGSEVNAESLLERGTYLVRNIAACGNCHTAKGPKGDIPGMELAGGLRIVEPGFSVVTPNITPDQETGIGSWSDEQIIRAIREGKAPDGRTLGPPMPFELYRKISDRDAKAMVAYLRSIKPVPNKVGKNKYGFPLPPAWGPPLTSVPDVPRNNPIKYGAYLAGPLAHCTLCHTPMKNNRFLFKTHLGAGGFPLSGPWGVVYSANITPDKKFGIGNWKDAEVIRAIKTGVRKDGGGLIPIMPFPYYAGMKQEDANAILAYLRSLKPVRLERMVRITPPGK